MCGKCFEDGEGAQAAGGWTGTRCDVCVSCGKCAEAWGLIKPEGADVDSGPTSWADAFKVMDTGSAGAPPPVTGAPGVAGDAGAAAEDAEAAAGAKEVPAEERAAAAAKPSSFACLKRGADGEEPDTSTGATPGVSSACKDHGFDDMDKLIADLGIKPPGVA